MKIMMRKRQTKKNERELNKSELQEESLSPAACKTKENQNKSSNVGS